MEWGDDWEVVRFRLGGRWGFDEDSSMDVSMAEEIDMLMSSEKSIGEG